MRTTVTLLGCAIALALGSAAVAQEQETTGSEETTQQQMQKQSTDKPATDPVDTVDDPADTVADPLTAQTTDSSTMDQVDGSAGTQLAPVDDMDEPDYAASTQDEAGPWNEATGTATGAVPSAGGAGEASAEAEPGDFASYDANADGFIERGELRGDNALLADAFVRFDVDDDNRLDRYEFDTFGSARFSRLDANADTFLDETEASAFAALGTSFTAVDLDGDGRISATEHQAFLDSDTWASPRDRFAFAYLDMDGDGFVSRTEAAVFTDFEAEFDVLDEDADGLVDSSQYDTFMNGWDHDRLAQDTEGQ